GIVECESVCVVDLARSLIVCPESIGVEGEVLASPEVGGRQARVEPDQVVVAGPGRVSARGDGADPGLLEEVLAETHGEEVLGGERTLVERRMARLDVQEAHLEAGLPARYLQAEEDRHLL